MAEGCGETSSGELGIRGGAGMLLCDDTKPFLLINAKHRFDEGFDRCL